MSEIELVLLEAHTHTVEFEGEILRRGFWLYVWEVTPPDGNLLLYVGRTGDNSSPYAREPYRRMGQHLGDKESVNMLRRKLEARDLDVAECSYRFIARGPFFDEAPDKDMDLHKPPRDVIGALEKALAEALIAVGYELLNTVNWNAPLDEELFAAVREAFGAELPRLLKAS